MVRLRSTATGAIVSVAEEKVARLGSEWVPVEETSPAPRKPVEATLPASRKPGRPRKSEESE